jgi:hypothetical protein
MAEAVATTNPNDYSVKAPYVGRFYRISIPSPNEKNLNPLVRASA